MPRLSIRLAAAKVAGAGPPSRGSQPAERVEEGRAVEGDYLVVSAARFVEVLHRALYRGGQRERADEVIAQHGVEALAVLIEVLLQQRYDAPVPGEVQPVGVLDAHQVAVTDLVLAVQPRGDAAVQLRQQRRQIHPGDRSQE